MAALVQTSTVTMLPTGPSSSNYQNINQMQQARRGQTRQGSYNSGNNVSYRGVSNTTPVPSYAFTSTPAVNTQGQSLLRQHPPSTALRHDDRQGPAINNAQTSTQIKQNTPSGVVAGISYVDAAKSVLKNEQPRTGPRWDSPPAPRPLSTLDPNQQTVPSGSVKPSPDRYRRFQRQVSGQIPTQPTGSGSAMPSGSGMATVGHLYSPPQYNSIQSFPAGSQHVSSKDDLNLSRHTTQEQAKRYRRRSINSIGANEDDAQMAGNGQKTWAAVASGTYVSQQPQAQFQQSNSRPGSSHGRNHSDESTASTRSSSSRPGSAKHETSSSPASTSSPTALQTSVTATKHEPKLVNVPARVSSDANKRLANPSPLSKPMSMGSESPIATNSAAQSRLNATQPTLPESSAAHRLAELNRKDVKKDGKPSRLRRAFSFGSAAELRKASAENSHNVNQHAKLQKKPHDEAEDKEAAIVRQQEASGLGESIYSGQGHFFTGSTDNLSVSSTASSASVMLRKMGKGMKKGTRSLVGLFRPKSVIGVPAADAALPQPSLAEVTMVTVEAEREKVNVNANPHDHAGGGTGFPKLERNSLDAASVGTLSTGTDGTYDGGDTRSRRSIAGGDRERAEVLAAVKKGILKRNGIDSGASSPVGKPADLGPASGYILPQLPRFDSPASSAPSTPRDDNNTPRGSHKRTDSVTIGEEDYFAAARMAEAKSLTGTPRIGMRGITFSPRIQFHDTWPSGEYDRRGDIATCNRLTPTLAQQIKEELNTFKMEMEVHESSKVYTHFF